MDGRSGIFPLYPADSMNVMPANTQLRQFADHSTFDDRGRSEYVEPMPMAEGETLILAPEDPGRRIRIQSLNGTLMLLDGRNVAQNGWYVVRTLIPSNKTSKVVEWLLTPTTIPEYMPFNMEISKQVPFRSKHTSMTMSGNREKSMVGRT